MKKMRKLVSILLTLVMCLSMSAAAFAEGEDIYMITINNPTDGYTYVAYQIFTGELSTDDDDNLVLANIAWGSSLNETVESALLTEYTVSTVTALAEAIDDAQSLAEFLADYTTGDNSMTSVGTLSYTGSNYTLSSLDAGYYLIVNTAVPESSEKTVYSNYIVQVVENVTMSPKSDVPTSTKTVDDVNDSDSTQDAEDQTSADYDIGDAVPFTLTATLPSYYSDYETYAITFHDELSDGLTFKPDSVVVTVYSNSDDTEGTVVGSGYSVEENPTDDCSFEVIIEDTNSLKDESGSNITVTKDSIIVVTYTATLNSNAVIGGSGNPNTMYIEYSNNPNDDSKTGTTPETKVVVYTYELTVNKTDEDGNALAGAGFTLYKYVGADVEGADEEGYIAVGSEVTAEAVYDPDDETIVVSYTANWTGLDDGQYKLVETTTPTGYNTVADVVFAITASHTTTSSSVSVNNTSLNVSDGTVSTTIENVKGSTLPSTGGIGTTIFYIVGGVLVLGAAVLLVTRKRLGSGE